MDDAIKSRIADAFGKLPDSCRFPKAREIELAHFEAEFGPIPIDYRWFLSTCGGGPVGPEWGDGIAQLAETHRKYRSECAIQHGWTMNGVFAVHSDYVVVQYEDTRRSFEAAISFSAIKEFVTYSVKDPN